MSTVPGAAQAAPFKRTELQRIASGDPFLIPPNTIHNARNIGTVTTKMLSTYFIDETQPVATSY
jgi:mannose-6-phosphate isomerase-like protein (cupin superfamily)